MPKLKAGTIVPTKTEEETINYGMDTPTRNGIKCAKAAAYFTGLVTCITRMLARKSASGSKVTGKNVDPCSRFYPFASARSRKSSLS